MNYRQDLRGVTVIGTDISDRWRVFPGTGEFDMTLNVQRAYHTVNFAVLGTLGMHDWRAAGVYLMCYALVLFVGRTVRAEISDD